MARPRPHKRAARAAAVSIITLTAALAAIWLAPRVSDAVATWVRTPPVRSATVSLPAGLAVTRPSAVAGRATTGSPSDVAAAASASAVTIDTGLRFTMIGVTCRPPRHAGGVLVDLRVSLDGRAWSRWYTASLDVETDAASQTPQAFTEAMWTGPGRYVQVAARRPTGSVTAPTALRDVRVVAIDSTESADAAAALLGVVRRTVAAIAGVSLVPPVSAMTTKPEIVTRSEWGADESLRGDAPSYADVKMAFVHHTDSGNDYTRDEAPSIVRGIYYYHTKSLGWSDIGYNFLVDKYGTVYEGRYGGMTKGVIGAQVLGFNTGSVGVSVIGTYSSVTPSAAAINALEELLAWRLDVSHIDPLGTATLTCAYGEKFATGESVEFPVISGHRQANYTDCPGDRLYALLPGIRKAVAALGQPKIYDLAVDSPYFSPNGDGVDDNVAVSFGLSEPADWKIEISDAEGHVVRSVSGQGSSVETTWAGNDNAGQDLPDGVYTLVASAQSQDGDARPATVELYLDTTPPLLQSAVVAPNPFSPNGDGQDDSAAVTFQPGEGGTARVRVIGDGDQVLRTLWNWRRVSAAAQTVTWDGLVSEDGKLVAAPEGRAVLQVEMRDLAGNSDTVQRAVVVDRTLGFPAVTPRVVSPNGDGVKDAATVTFKLTRRADVTLSVLDQGGQVVQTIPAGTLGSGAEEVVWDGRLASGEDAASGTYELRVTADSSLGTTSVSVPVVVDRTAPRLTVPAVATAAAGSTAKISYTVRDRLSPTVRVSVAVSDAAGNSVGSVACGWVSQGVAATCSWTPPMSGAYTLTFTAVDRAGNAQTKPAVTVLTVR